MPETEPLIKGVRSDILLDPSTEVSGFIASELEQEELLRDPTYHSTDNGDDIEAQVDVPDTLSQNRINVIVGSMFVGVFLAALDGTVVTTLVSRIASEFDSLPKLSWIATAYLLSSSTFQPLYGKLSDIFGRKPLLLFSNLTFALGCLICATAQDVNVLIFGRFISGIGGGGLTSLSSITTSDVVPLKNRGLYQGITNIAFACGSGAGSLLGGVFVNHEELLGGWRGAFGFQVPLTIISAYLIYKYLALPKGSPGLGVAGFDITRKLKLIDWYGSATLIVFLFSFLTAASLGGKEIAYSSPQFIALSVLTTSFLGLFIFVECKAVAPILPLHFMKIPTVTGVSISLFCFCMTSFAVYFIIPIYYTTVFNLNSQQIGWRFAPNFFTIIFGSVGAGYYMKTTGKYYYLNIISGFIAVFGTLRIAMINPSYTTFEQYLLIVTQGMGVSVIITSTLLALIAAVPHEHQAATTSISYLFRSCGSTLGVAIGSAIMSRRLDKELETRVMSFLSDKHPLDELVHIIDRASHNTEYVHGGAPEWVKQTLIDSYAVSTKQAFSFCLVTSIVGLASLFLIKEYTLHSTLTKKVRDIELYKNIC
ncbi:Multidrug resistance protein fnx1 [Cyberlindnera fabianii]|uniref:Multidrug resistance protein fnx1 n=1 Tax=Cyberlindnera fabianii TaxID=36022 RepID=A0A1V2L8N5_CYBFA|nr:Multidrug resistance protein fnx1 [Cyberlindnera fabianii]